MNIFVVIRVVISLLFIISGWVKAIDPMGTYLKVDEYIKAFGFEINSDFVIVLSVVFCAIELFLGLMLLFKLCEKYVWLAISGMMLFFTILTGLIVIVPSLGIEECGCFGDAINISMQTTFIKNIIATALSIICTLPLLKSIRTSCCIAKEMRKATLAIYSFIFVATLSIPIYSLLFLPAYSYIPYEVGDTLSNDFSEDEVSTILVYRNIKSGEIEEFDINSTEWHDDTKWEYVDTKSSVNGKDINSINLSFSLYNSNRDNVTDEVVKRDGYTFLIVAEDIEEITPKRVEELNSLISLSSAGVVDIAIVTASANDITGNHIEMATPELNVADIYTADNILIKSLIRDKYGVMGVNNGVIIAKWNSRLNRVPYLTNDSLDGLHKRENSRKVWYFIYVSLLSAAVVYAVAKYHKRINNAT